MAGERYVCDRCGLDWTGIPDCGRGDPCGMSKEANFWGTP